MKEVREKAKELMKGYCRVCPVCNGKACAGEVPGMGGLNTASSFRNNVESLAAVQLNMRLIHDAVQPDTSVTVLGIPLSMPVMAAPIGGVSFNMGGGITEEEYVNAILGGCRQQGVIGCTGDGVPPFIIDAGMDGIAAVEGHGIPFIKPWDGEELDQKLDRALASACPAVGMDIDAAGLVTLRKMGRPVSPKTPAQLKAVVDKVHAAGRTFILKGIMTVVDAQLAVEVGADAIVVSNHGGRVLDHTPGAAEVLPEIADAVKGRITVLADGGVRDGFDVIKMLALGADAVLIGRPFSIAAVGGQAEGVAAYLEALRGQLVQAMVLTGCRSVQEAGRHILRGI
ncbi:(S)-2-hydroxy-acid oxidase [Oleidesulfovibrio alaskensis G20]|jgi:isopentenyl diphosphate isomerase/L-lactate dehydrogenase-like FMN-dependent dehydrogenase|uniref:(S)-2-hydroxy-acid oxidase n=1 Tax=Oleidesulfovibrio alaskensis (strain ATCC BAA-1058 / DSM 17464 / G20) TaxID=207559 RepID=Q314U5_OLEA2|nr:alpha-hydroxy-acid oxidizing protein [Oleidesulfovibrio alaskensis]ABB37551.1 (S)-2-hydroxy-acid oxidase [Oleidesulfovibrio alaskensis G20]MBG0773157.1 alpha-hydroxy-acid oxidizing protein [Oleidesulfovibrio alaskensis]